MVVLVRPYGPADVAAMVPIWNAVVRSADAFPQVRPLAQNEAEEFFAAQSLTAVAEVDGEVAGLYILHPNNVGRCAHVANASYAVDSRRRGRGVGEALVRHCLDQLAPLGFTGLQFNAVVASNVGAIHLYEKLGFVRIGVIPQGFRNGHNELEDIIIFYHGA